MGAFWGSWQLWEKLCFVLGVGIVSVLSIGFVKSRYNKRKIKKYQAIADQRQAQNGTNGRDVSEIRKNAVPFGIRAIESGIEVEGVWISRSNINTPSESPLLTPVVDAGKQPGHSPSSTIAPQLVLPPALHIRGETHSSPSNRSSSGFDRAVSAEQQASTNDSPNRSSASFAPQQNPTRPASQRKISAHDTVLENSDNMDPSMRQVLALREAETNINSDSEQSDLGLKHYIPRRVTLDRSPSTSDNIAVRAPSKIDLLPFTESRGDLRSLDRHRRSHAADMGDLKRDPNRGRPSSSDFTHSQAPSSASSRKEQEFPNSCQAQTGPILSDPANEPPLQVFANSHLVPSPQQRPEERLLDTKSKETTTQRQSTSSHDGHSHRNSVTRIVNSGFEVLPAGTFGNVGEVSDWNLDLEQGGRKEPRKLQKKNQRSST